MSSTNFYVPMEHKNGLMIEFKNPELRKIADKREYELMNQFSFQKMNGARINLQVQEFANSEQPKALLIKEQEMDQAYTNRIKDFEHAKADAKVGYEESENSVQHYVFSINDGGITTFSYYVFDHLYVYVSYAGPKDQPMYTEYIALLDELGLYSPEDMELFDGFWGREG